MVNIQSLGLVHNYKLLVNKFAHSKVHIEKVVLQLTLEFLGTSGKKSVGLENSQQFRDMHIHAKFESLEFLRISRNR